MKNIIFSLFIIVLLSCNKHDDNKQINNKKSNSFETNTYSLYSKKFRDNHEIKNLINKIKKEGDTIAFESLKEIYYNSNHKNEFLYYSMYMANAYRYNYAFYTNYSVLMTDIITEQNKINNIYANYYLLKSYELGYKRALGSIEERFGTTSNIPNSKEYLLKTLPI